jgi:hypothetical protein
MTVGCGVAAPDDASRMGGDAGCDEGDVRALSDGRVTGGVYVSRVVSFSPGAGASFGASEMPGIVMGPPQGAGDFMGSTDTVSLGRGGEIVVAFDLAITDGPGADFVVFENPFQVPGAPVRYWEELGEVSVSDDGETWRTFACDPRAGRPYTHCAGWNPVYSAPGSGYCPTDLRTAGGDPFDLAAVGLRRARYVRIRDLATQGLSPPATGFDLDAIAVIHPLPR